LTGVNGTSVPIWIHDDLTKGGLASVRAWELFIYNYEMGCENGINESMGIIYL